MSTARRAWTAALFAVTFLTVVPVGAREDGVGAADAPAWYPLVGALIGTLGGAVLALLEPLLGMTAATLFGVLATVVVTGGIHQDGLADCADGLGVRADRERRLTVMRDPRVGTYGVLALLFWGLLLTSTLAQLSVRDAVVALIVSAAVGRWASLLHAVTAAPARPDGLGTAFHVARIPLVVATITVVVLALVVAGPIPGLGTLVAGAVTLWSRAWLGGRTGDSLGTAVVLTELAVCVVLLAAAR